MRRHATCVSWMDSSVAASVVASTGGVSTGYAPGTGSAGAAGAVVAGGEDAGSLGKNNPWPSTTSGRGFDGAGVTLVLRAAVHASATATTIATSNAIL